MTSPVIFAAIRNLTSDADRRKGRTNQEIANRIRQILTSYRHLTFVIDQESSEPLPQRAGKIRTAESIAEIVIHAGIAIESLGVDANEIIERVSRRMATVATGDDPGVISRPLTPVATSLPNVYRSRNNPPIDPLPRGNMDNVIEFGRHRQ